MTAYELLDLATAINGRLDLQMSLFVTIHLALFGGIIYIDRPLVSLEKLSAAFIYSIFAGLSYLMMSVQAELVIALYSDALKFLSDPCCENSSVLARIDLEMSSGRQAYTRALVIGVHSFFYIAVILSILFDGKIKKSNPKN